MTWIIDNLHRCSEFYWRQNCDRIFGLLDFFHSSLGYYHTNISTFGNICPMITHIFIFPYGEINVFSLCVSVSTPLPGLATNVNSLFFIYFIYFNRQWWQLGGIYFSHASCPAKATCTALRRLGMVCPSSLKRFTTHLFQYSEAEKHTALSNSLEGINLCPNATSLLKYAQA